MPKGGKRVGAGRPKGQRNKKTIEQVEAVKAAGITPLDYMLQTLRNEELPHEDRMDAAHKAAPYVHPKLSSVDHQSSDGTMSPQPMVDPELLSDESKLEILNAATKRG